MTQDIVVCSEKFHKVSVECCLESEGGGLTTGPGAIVDRGFLYARVPNFLQTQYHPVETVGNYANCVKLRNRHKKPIKSMLVIPYG